MGRRLEGVAKPDDSVNVDMEPEEALRLLLDAEPEKDNEGMDAEEKAFLERAAAWNRGEFDAMPQPEDPDDVMFAQPKLPNPL
jgi:hypothetical protein